MAKFPMPEDIGLPAIQGRPGVIRDDSAQILASGIEGLGSGLASAAGSLYAIRKKELAQQNVTDISSAESEFLKGSLELENEFEGRQDYENFAADAKTRTQVLKERAASMIRDPKMRSSWMGDAELKTIAISDKIGDLGRARRKEADGVKFETALLNNARLVEDPTVDPRVREQALIDMQGSMIRALETGTIGPEQGMLFRDKYLDRALENFQINTGRLEMQSDPAMVMTKTGVSAALGGMDIGQSIITTQGAPIVLASDQAALVAKSLGDTALPTDPKLQKAYLKDPEINAKYAGEAVDVLTKRYNGDMTAAVIALAPGSSPELVREWISSGHDESKLPKPIKDFYRQVMSSTKAPANLMHIPTVAEPGILIEDIEPDLLDRYEQLQSVFGQQMVVISGKRDPQHNEDVGGAPQSEHLSGNAIDIDVTGMKEGERIRLIEAASGMGFGGIGIYDNSLHLDLGQRRGWGPSHGSESIPKWAEATMAAHQRGEITEIPGAVANVDPAYGKLSFDQRMSLYNEAKQELDRQAIERRAGIEVSADNAPQAIFATGKYEGYLPTAEDFVAAYGGADGVAKYKEFSLAVDVARQSFAMKTMSLTDIADMLEAKVPVSTGDMAGFEAKRYAALVEGAAAIKKARDADPAGYTLEAFPGVAAKFEEYGKSPEASSAAISAMSLAQDMLGIEKKQLLPKPIVDSQIAVFNDKTQPMEVRMDGIVQTIFATEDPGQRRALLQQFKDAGMPDYSDPVFAAMERGDENGSRYLIRALLTDPKDLPSDLGAEPREINEAVASVYGDGEIGQVTYGTSGAPSDQNFQRAMTDAVLFERAVKLRLADGSAASADDAVRLTIKDMWGDVKVARAAGNQSMAGMEITLPIGENEETYRTGFTMLLPSVSEALFDQMTKRISSLPTADGSLQMAVAVRDNEIKMQLAEGHFANAGNDQYQFLDMDGIAVTGEDGKPLIFTSAEIKAASAKWAQGSNTYQQPPAGFGPATGVMQDEAARQRENDLRRYLLE